MAASTKPYRGKHFKGLNHCTTNYSVYLFKCIRILTVQVSATENRLTNASKSEPRVFFRNKSLFLLRHALFGEGRGRGRAPGTSQQPKWAKPRTASSLGLLSHSCLGLALGTALDLSLWICAITSKVGSATPASLSETPQLEGCKNGTRIRSILQMFAYASK